MDDLIKKGAIELGQIIKKGEISIEELIKVHLKRIKEVNLKNNAITISLKESALELTLKSDKPQKKKKKDLILHQ